MKVIRFGDVIVFLLLISHKAHSARILGVIFTFSQSHLIIHKAIIDSIADRGHNVTIVTTLPLDEPNKTYRHIQLNIEANNTLFHVARSSSGSSCAVCQIARIVESALVYTDAALQHPKMQKLMAEETFDLVILGYTHNPILIGLADHFKCPYIFNFIHRPTAVIDLAIGNPLGFTTVPHVFHTGPLDFFGRVRNIVTILTELISLQNALRLTEKLYRNHFPPDKGYAPFSDMVKNVSLVFSIYHFSAGVVRPLLPTVVDVAGIQIKAKPEPLPKDIQMFLDQASEGAIYFSLGSNVRSADLSTQMVHDIYNVFSRLRQRVIWKWDGIVVPGNASNILFKTWTPQTDILAHPNTKLFITHGGHGSVVESQYHGVPMIGIPFFADQFGNLNIAKRIGIAVVLDKDKFIEATFRRAILEVLGDSNYQENVKKASEIFRDRPMSPRETAAYWIEYVIRHRGASHMQSSAVHMNFIQYCGLDILGLLLLSTFICYEILIFTVKRFLFCVVYVLRKPDGQKQINRKKTQ